MGLFKSDDEKKADLNAEGVKAAGYVPDSATIAMPRKRASYDCSNCHY